ncbi:MAG: hypothetical protein KC466_02635, partial [Myxococcales bacterium]|nr:hypothetical protein [Myxococcales bacterium]
VSQDEFDGVHGEGAFAVLGIPDLAARNADANRYLPASGAWPRAEGIFRSVPTPVAPDRADLGLWNVLGNPEIPRPQARILEILCAEPDAPAPCDAASVLDRAVARFKTPSLRDLGQSGPYFHTGAKDSLEAVIRHYERFSALARDGGVRNGAPELAGIALVDEDVAPLAAFLRSLDEDYD